MSRLTSIIFALSFLALPAHALPVRGLLVQPSPLNCPEELPSCSDAHSFCLSNNTGSLGNMNFTCHAGISESELGEYSCTTDLINCTGAIAMNECKELPVDLGYAEGYSVLAGAAVTNTGKSRVTGDLGVYPGSQVTGFPPGKMLAGSVQEIASVASRAAIDSLAIAFNKAAGRSKCPFTLKIGEIGGLTLPPGLYKSTSGMEITANDLILDGEHDDEAVWIFQITSTFSSAVSMKIILKNGAKASNVFWQVGTSGTIGATNVFEGTMMADQAITLGTGAIVNGRVLARIASVTLLANIITISE